MQTLDLPIISNKFHFYGKTFYCSIVLLSSEECLYFIASNNFVEILGVPGTRIGFLKLLSKDSKVPIYYSPVA